MAIDKEIKAALIAAVETAGQDSALADRLIAWFEGVATESISLDDREMVSRHISLLFAAMHVEVPGDMGQEDDGGLYDAD